MFDRQKGTYMGIVRTLWFVFGVDLFVEKCDERRELRSVKRFDVRNHRLEIKDEQSILTRLKTVRFLNSVNDVGISSCSSQRNVR